MSKIRPLVQPSQALASLMFKYSSMKLKCFPLKNIRSLSSKTAGYPVGVKFLPFS